MAKQQIKKIGDLEYRGLWWREGTSVYNTYRDSHGIITCIHNCDTEDAAKRIISMEREAWNWWRNQQKGKEEK